MLVRGPSSSDHQSGNELTCAGALIAAGVTYKTADIVGSWSWRMPVALQGIFTILSFACLFFVPESPRWLVHKGRLEDALTSLASTHSDGDETDEVTLMHHQEIIDTLALEREVGQKMTYAEIFRTPNSRRRLLLVVSIAVIAQSSGELGVYLQLSQCLTLAGNNIVSYYLGDMLTHAGITDQHTQLEINIILTAWSLVVALIGTWLVNSVGRKSMALVSIGGMVVTMFLVGILTKCRYSERVKVPPLILVCRFWRWSEHVRHIWHCGIHFPLQW